MAINFLNVGAFPDDVKLTFGAGSDLQIFHNATDSIIYNGTGALMLRGNDVRIQSADASETMATFTLNDRVKLYFDNAVKFETYSAGAGITGNLYFTSGSKIHFDNGVSNDYYIEKSGTALTFNTGGTYVFNNGDVTFSGANTYNKIQSYYSGDYISGWKFSDYNGGIWYDAGLDDLTLNAGHANSQMLFNSGGALTLTLDASQDATFVGDVNISGGNKLALYQNDDNYITYNSWYIWTGSDIIIRNSGTGPFKFQTNGANDVLTLDSSQEATFHGDILTNTDSSSDIGKTATRWANIWVDSINGDTYSGPYLPLAGGTMTGTILMQSGYINFNDNQKAIWGNGSDLQIFHDAADSIIDNNVGHLYITQHADDKDIIFRSDDGSGGVAVYFYVSGTAGQTIFSKDTEHQDSIKAQFGNSGDLKIYHDSSDSYMENANGDMYFMQRKNDGDMVFQCDDQSGGDTTYFKLDGGVGETIFSRNTQHLDSVYAQFGTGKDMQLYHSGTSSVINNDTGDFIIKTSLDDGDIYFQADNGSGGVATYFYMDGSAVNGTSVKGATKFPDASKIYMGTGGDLEIFHNGSQAYIENYTGEFNFTQHLNDGDMLFKCDDGAGGTTTYLQLDGGEGYTVAYKNIRFDDNVSALFGTSGDMTIKHDGSNSKIENNTGHFYIINEGTGRDIIFQSDDGSGGVTEYLKIDGGVVYTIASKDINFVDSVSATFGTGIDAFINHSGSAFNIYNDIGAMNFIQRQNDGNMVFQSDDGSGGTATYFSLDGGSSATNELYTKWPDYSRIALGTGKDLLLYHDGLDSYIDQVGTGDLIIRTAGSGDDVFIRAMDDVFIQPKNGEAGVYVYSDGAVELYYDSSKKLETTDVGATIHGNLNLNDNGHLRFGAGNDLDIYHDGTDSYINNNTGILNITNNDIRFKTTGAETMLRAVANGAVELMYDNVVKFSTASTGISVTGDVAAATLTLTGKGTSAATVDGDGSTTMATKGWVESKLTGATLYQGTWDPSGGGYGSPDLSTAALQVNGYYYICSADGTAEPNGTGTEPDTWHTGDWVIWNDDVGSGEWQKIDNTTVLSGAGTGDYLARWTDTETLGDSIVLVSGNDILIPQYIRHTSDPSDDTYFGFSANDTFTVYTAGGEGLNIDSNRAVTLTGTLTGTSATFTGNITLNSRITFDYGGDHYLESGTDTWAFKNSSGTSTFQLNFSTHAATFAGHLIPTADNTIDLGTTDSKDFRTLYIRNIDVYNNRLIIDASGTIARFSDHPTVGDGLQFIHLGTEILRLGNGSSTTATFAGNVVINGADVDIASVIRHIGNTTTYFGFPADNEWRVVTSSTEAFKLDANQLATFAGDVQLAATKKLYLDGSNNTYIVESSDGVIDFYGDNTFLVSMKQNGTQSEVVVNEGSGDVDFRVEANNDAQKGTSFC